MSIDRLKVILGDHENGSEAICRHETGEDVATNACVIMNPDTRELHACRGPSHTGIWRTVGF